MDSDNDNVRLRTKSATAPSHRRTENGPGQRSTETVERTSGPVRGHSEGAQKSRGRRGVAACLRVHVPTGANACRCACLRVRVPTAACAYGCACLQVIRNLRNCEIGMVAPLRQSAEGMAKSWWVVRLSDQTVWGMYNAALRGDKR